MFLSLKIKPQTPPDHEETVPGHLPPPGSGAGARREPAGPRGQSAPPGDGAGSLLAAVGQTRPGTGLPEPRAAPRPSREAGGGALRSRPRRLPAAPRLPAGRALAVVSRRPDAPADPGQLLRLLPPPVACSAAAPGPSGVAGALGRGGAHGSGIGRAARGVRYPSPGPGPAGNGPRRFPSPSP